MTDWSFLTRGLLNKLWPAITERRPLCRWALPQPPKAVSPRPEYKELGAEYDPIPQARKHAEPHPFSPWAQRAWADLTEAVRRRGIRLVIVQPPVDARYMNWIAEHQPDTLARYEAYARSLAGPGVHVLLDRALPDDAPRDPPLLYDYGHFTPTGGEWFSKRIAARLRAAE